MMGRAVFKLPVKGQPLKLLVLLLFLAQTLSGFVVIKEVFITSHKDCSGPYLEGDPARVDNDNFPHYENNSYGGSWFDDFDNYFGIAEGAGKLAADVNTMALWHFDEGDGQILVDSSGNGNHGRLGSTAMADQCDPPWAEGRCGDALEFDGIDDCVHVSHSASLKPVNEMSAEVWAYKDDWSGPNKKIVSCTEVSGYSLGASSGPDFELAAIRRNDAYGMVFFDAANLTPGWHHFAFTFDGRYLKGFVDGSLVDINDAGGHYPVQYHSSNSIYIGTEASGGTHPGGLAYFNGRIDELRISNIARSSEVVARNYLEGLVLRSGKLQLDQRDFTPDNECKAYWNFGEESGTTAYDLSGNGNDGTINGAKYVKGVQGTALEFDGVDDYVNCGNCSSLNFGDSTDFTFEAWIKGELTGLDKLPAIIGRRNPDLPGDNPTDADGYIFYFSPSGELGFQINDDVAGNYYAVGENLLNRFWHHVAVTGDRDGDLIFYVDGHLKKQYDISSENAFDSNKSVFIGWEEQNPTASHFKGIIDELAVFSRALDKEEIQRHSQIYHPYGFLISTPITLPEGMKWDSLSLVKMEPIGTLINVSVLDGDEKILIPNSSASCIDLSELTNQGVETIRLQAWFTGKGSATPTLDSWGVEWVAENAWRDSFIGDGKVDRIASTLGELEPDDNTMGLWHFDEGSGYVVRDYSGNDNHGTIHGANWTDGMFDGGLEFDGVDDHVRIPDDPTLDISAAITVEAWIMTSVTQGWPAVIYKGYSEERNYDLRISNGYANFHYMKGGKSQFMVDSTTMVGDGNWHNIVCTWDGTTVKVYVDGILESSEGWVGTLQTNDQDLFLGWSFPFSIPMYYKGIIDEVRISSIARTPEEIAENYRTGLEIRGGSVKLTETEFNPGDDPACVGYWNFDEGNGEVLKDLSGNGNDGSLNNFDLNDASGWCDGRNGGGLRFDGANDYVEVPHSESLNISDEITIEMWAKADDWLANRNQRLIWKGPSPGENTESSYFIYYRSTNKLEFCLIEGIGVYGTTTPSPLNNNQWYHIAGTYDGATIKLYINGMEVHSMAEEFVINTVLDSLLMGLGENNRYFKGVIDEVAIYNRALSSQEIRVHCLNPHSRYDLRICSKPISLPDNSRWSSLGFHRTVPTGAFLNVSVHDAKTDELLTEDLTASPERSIDLTAMDPVQHPKIYLKAQLGTIGGEMPQLHDWGVNWLPWAPPELIQAIPDIEIWEESPAKEIMNVTDFFSDPAFQIHEPTYDIAHISDSSNLSLKINGSSLDLMHLADNFTGNVSIKVNCTNYFGLTSSSNSFNITVKNIDDAPVWVGTPEFNIDSGGFLEINFSILDQYVLDIEDDEIAYEAVSPPSELEITIPGERVLRITPKEGYSGEINFTLRAYEVDNLTSYADQVVQIQVISTGPEPFIELVSPMNNTTHTALDITLSWKLHYDDGSITLFDLYFGPMPDPPLFRQDLAGEGYSVENLGDQTTYYWYVLPHGSYILSDCINGTWQFNINLSASVPQVQYTKPLNGSTMNTTEVELEWQLVNPWDGELHYDVWAGIEKDNLIKMGTSDTTSFQLTDLKDNVTYYWEIIPRSESIVGRSISGVWEFTVIKGFVSVNTISWHVDKGPIRVKEGEAIFSFNLTINNTGNNPNTVTLSVLGTMKGKALFDSTYFSLKPGESQIVLITLLTSGLGLGMHDLNIELLHIGGMDPVDLNVEVYKEIPPVSEITKEKKSGFKFIYVLIPLILVIIAVVIILLIIRRKKDSYEDKILDSDTVEVDIVYIPDAGKKTGVSSMPHLETEPEFQVVPSTPEPGYNFKENMDPFIDEMDIPELSFEPLLPEETKSHEREVDMSVDLSQLLIPSEDPDRPRTQPILALPPARLIVVPPEQLMLPIDEIFLMTSAGLPIHHYSLTEGTDLDEDILMSMISAVTSFISDSLSSLAENEENAQVNRIDFGKYSVMTVASRNLVLVGISAHEEKDLILESLQKGVAILEMKFGEAIANWEGDMEEVEVIIPYMECLVKGELEKMETGDAIMPRDGMELSVQDPGTVEDEEVIVKEGSSDEFSISI